PRLTALTVGAAGAPALSELATASTSPRRSGARSPRGCLTADHRPHHAPRAMHPWHDIYVDEGLLPQVPAVIEVPQGSKNKYEVDKETGFLRLDRVLFSAVHYPANYGFI